MKKLTAILMFSLIPVVSFAASDEASYEMADASSAQVIADYSYDYGDGSSYGYTTTTESEPYYTGTSGSSHDAPDPD